MVGSNIEPKPGKPALLAWLDFRPVISISALWQVTQNPAWTCRVSVNTIELNILVFSSVPSGRTMVLSL